MDAKKFKFSNNDGGHGKSSGAEGEHVQRRPKRHRRDSDVDAETDGDDQDDDDDGNTRYMHGPGESRQIRHSDAHPLDSNVFCSMPPQREQTEPTHYKSSWIPTVELDNGTASVLLYNEVVLAISSGGPFTIRAWLSGCCGH